jgi:hypothetical protein
MPERFCTCIRQNFIVCFLVELHFCYHLLSTIINVLSLTVSASVLQHMILIPLPLILLVLM